jgi:diguanylate cyclase
MERTPVSSAPRTSDRENSILQQLTDPPCTTTAKIPLSETQEEMDLHLRAKRTARDAHYARKFEARQNHWDLQIAALRALLAKTQEELTGAQEREKRARYLAFHDDLTALPNRRFFRERLDLALREEGGAGVRPLAVFYLDLDGFKALNDLYGHDTGDELLGTVARRLSHALRAEDLVSRLAGDEYACLITGLSCRKRLQQLAATLFHAVSAPFKIGVLELTVHPSIGIAMYPSDGSTTDQLLKAADSAMYMAKRLKSSYAFFRTDLEVTEMHRDLLAGSQLPYVGHRTD